MRPKRGICKPLSMKGKCLHCGLEGAGSTNVLQSEHTGGFCSSAFKQRDGKGLIREPQEKMGHCRDKQTVTLLYFGRNFCTVKLIVIIYKGA